jgi:hypothetical protein
MRQRTLHEMLRDSHVGSIIVAKFIAEGLSGLVSSIGWPLAHIVESLVNFVVTRIFHDAMVPFTETWTTWKASALTFGATMVLSVLALAVAYLLAVWVYTPVQRKRVILPMATDPQ